MQEMAIFEDALEDDRDCNNNYNGTKLLMHIAHAELCKNIKCTKEKFSFIDLIRDQLPD